MSRRKSFGDRAYCKRSAITSGLMWGLLGGGSVLAYYVFAAKNDTWKERLTASGLAAVGLGAVMGVAAAWTCRRDMARGRRLLAQDRSRSGGK